MVGLLGGNVTPYVLQTGSAHRERTVSRLPAEVLACRELLMHPPAGVGLQHPQQIGHRNGRGHRQQQVNVIGRTVDDQRRPFQFSHDAPHVREQSARQFSRQVRFAVSWWRRQRA